MSRRLCRGLRRSPMSRWSTAFLLALLALPRPRLPIDHGCVLRLGAAVPKPVLWRRRSAAAGGEKQHQPGEPAVDQVEAGVVEEPFHLAAGIDPQPTWPHERGGRCAAEAGLLR